jgi:hypothetical protein
VLPKLAGSILLVCWLIRDLRFLIKGVEEVADNIILKMDLIE